MGERITGESRCRHEEPKDTNIIGNITKLLPANTFLMFQMLAPLSTNDGNCGPPEKIMTSAMLIILASTCMLVCFTDTLQFRGKVYHGLVTRKGLWNPSFKSDPSFTALYRKDSPKTKFSVRGLWICFTHLLRDQNNCSVKKLTEKTNPYVVGSTYSSGDTQYELNGTDFLHSMLSAMAFGTLTMLTTPVTKCFYPKIPVTVVKTLPLLVGFVISGIFAFSPPARNGIAHPLSPKAHEPSNPPGKGDDDNANPKPVDEDSGGSVKKQFGNFFASPDHEKGKSGSPTEHQQLLDGVKALASGVYSKYGDQIKHGAEKIVHSLEGGAKEEANRLLHKAAPAVAELSKDIHVSLALQEAAKSVPHDALVAGLVNAGAHPTLAKAAVQSAVQDAKDVALTQIYQELQAAMSGPLVGLSKQSSMALTRANSMLQSSGSSLSLPSGPDALFHQAAQVLQHQVSGLSPNLQAAGSEAAAIVLASRLALMQAGYQLPSSSQSPQATALNAFAPNIGNQLNLNSVNELIKDANSLVQPGSKSLAEIHEELVRQGMTLNSQMQAFYIPGSSAAQNIVAMANSDSQATSQGTLTATLAAMAARKAGTLLLEGANHGITGLHSEIARQKAAAVQSFTQSVTSLAQDAASGGLQSLSDAKAELLKQKEDLTQEMNMEARVLSAPATNVAQDLAALVTTQVESQPTVSAVKSQFVKSLALDVAQGMAQAGSQPAVSVAIDIASLLQQGSQMHAQLARQASALSPQMQVAATMMQRQMSLEEFQQSTAADTHMAFRHLASQLSSPPLLSSPAIRVSQGMSTSPSNWSDNASVIIEDVTAATAASQSGVGHAQRGAEQLRRVTEEIVAQAAVRAPTASQVALASRTHNLHPDRQESTEIMDSISTEEITSESEAELSNRGDFRAATSSSFNFQAPLKRK